jgi:L-asparaginase / beta-aspartyl-peptidase
MYALAIHGGAGTLPRQEMNAEQESAYRAALSAALAAGGTILERGGAALDAVCAAVVELENCPLFNAGRGAVFTLDGRNELDASLMDGSTLAAGAVCGLTRIANPVLLARSVMEHGEFVMLSGAGAEDFAQQRGFAFVPASYFHTDARWSQLQRVREGDSSVSPLTISHVGTVGAVALDTHGHLAAATSTGGMTGKRWGRIGDSPIIGAGTYADDRACAVSATGHGEAFIRAAVAHDIAARVRHGGRTLHDAVREVVHGELLSIAGEGGVIAVDREGNISLQFNSEGMFRASQRSGEAPLVAIYDT